MAPDRPQLTKPALSTAVSSASTPRTARLGLVLGTVAVLFWSFGSSLIFLGARQTGTWPFVSIAALVGLTTPDRGSVRVCGLEVQQHLQAVQQQINLVRGFSGVLEKFTTWELLSYYAMLYGAPRARVDEVMALAGITSQRDAQVALLSSGWRQRFFIAKGMINRPRVLFMDEPTVGLDVDAAMAVRDIIRELNRGGCTILLTTHYMREAEELCDRIALISEGRIVAEGTAAELKEQVKSEEAILIQGQLDPPLRERLARVNEIRARVWGALRGFVECMSDKGAADADAAGQEAPNDGARLARGLRELLVTLGVE